jgi:fumarate hydratase class I
MTVIKQDDLIESVAAALQFISYYHPADYIAHLARAYEAEQSPAAKDAIAQILTNSRMCAEGHRPICQDTGIVNVFLKIGMGVRFEGFSGSIIDAVNEGVRQGYNLLKISCVLLSLLTRSLNAKIPKTTRQPWFTWNWFRAIPLM